MDPAGSAAEMVRKPNDQRDAKPDLLADQGARQEKTAALKRWGKWAAVCETLID